MAINTYGDSSATSPKQQYIKSLASYKYDDNPAIYRSSDNYGFNNPDEFLSAGGDFSNVEVRQRPQPQSLPSSTPPPVQPPTSQTLNTDQTPYKKAMDDYISSLGPSPEVTGAQKSYNDFVANAQLGIKNKEGQGRGIPLELVRGQQAKLADQSEIEAKRLQGDIGIAQDAQTLSQNKNKAQVDYERTLLDDQRQSKQDAQSNLDNILKLSSGRSYTELSDADRANIDQATAAAGLSSGLVRSSLGSANRDKFTQAGITSPYVAINGVMYDTGTGEAFNDAQSFLQKAGVSSFDEARSKGLYSDYNPSTPNDAKLVTEIATKYPDAGVGLGDTLATAQAKISGSKIYQDQIRPPTGTTNSTPSTKLITKADAAKYNIAPSTPQGALATAKETARKVIKNNGGKVTEQNRYDLWGKTADALKAAGYDPTDYDAVLWEDFHPEGLAGYKKYVLGKSDSSSGITNPFG